MSVTLRNFIFADYCLLLVVAYAGIKFQKHSGSDLDLCDKAAAAKPSRFTLSLPHLVKVCE